MREVRYRAIADELRERVGAGEFGAGRLLPSESELSASFGVSRVTVRKALELLRDEGLIDARQGFGWFVVDRPGAPAAGPARHDRGAAGRARPVVGAARSWGSGSWPRRPGCARCWAPPSVLEVRRVNLADGEPFARVTVWCREDLGAAAVAGRGRARHRSTSWSTWPSGRRPRRIGAVAAGPQDAALLAVPVGSPMLRCERVTRDAADEPVLVSEFLFPAHRTEFVVDLPRVEPSIGPSGLRLVE